MKQVRSADSSNHSALAQHRDPLDPVLFRKTHDLGNRRISLNRNDFASHHILDAVTFELDEIAGGIFYSAQYSEPS